MLFAARSATALHRLLDVLPVFAGDDRIARRFTLVPGSAFDVDALAAVERAGGRTVPWEQARGLGFDLILAASPKGRLELLAGERVLLPHGAGFGKTLPGEGTPGAPSGLDPEFLLADGEPLAALHALAHPQQVDQLAAFSPRAAARAVVVGDPTLERLLASVGQRSRFRAALGTGARRLLVLTSTWGPESLLRRRPGLAAELLARLPLDGYQLALILHPNERSRLGSLDLAQSLAPALDAGLSLPGPHAEWGSLLVAADAVITDHGSTALYAAALDRPVIAAYDGGDELIPGSPMARLLAASPRLTSADGLAEAWRAASAARGVGPALAALAFAERGRALELLREELYALLGLAPVGPPPAPEPLPTPRRAAREPVACAVNADVVGDALVTVERFPPWRERPARLLAAEQGAASERQAQSAGLLYRRAGGAAPAAPHLVAWTAAGWIDETLRRYPGCALAGVVLSATRAVLRTRAGALLRLELAPLPVEGRLVHTDPAAVLCAAHAWLTRCPGGRAAFDTRVGHHVFPTTLAPATPEDADHPL
ncbi:CDP-glycerol glycerophosphotransferase family protein [Streptomyces profundus]|uniref:CDP-glycerol glycerophosphotransferase family protein n=1 Tax=Streptomyces profundus TaxID=2867410 RepID=UPI001D16941A